MQEQTKLQHIPVKIYRSHEHLTVAGLMPGLEPEDILVEVTEQGELVLHGDMRATLKDVTEVLLDEWGMGVYHRELALPEPVDGEHANVTYGNGVLVVALLLSEETQPARITLEKIAAAHGEYRGNPGGHSQQ